MAMSERAIFEAALEFADATARAAFLENACGDDAGLRASVEALLKSHNVAGEFSHCEDTAPMRSALANDPSEKPSRNQILAAMLIGILAMMPIMIGRQRSEVFSKWFWPETPSISSTAAFGRLNFDGQSDFVKVSQIDWSYAQFTIEAFVT